MSYKVIEIDINLDKMEFNNILDLYQKFIEELKDYETEFLHYNIYPHGLTIRFESLDEKTDGKVKDILQKLKEKKSILDYRVYKDRTVKKTLKAAHYLASRSVLELHSNQKELYKKHFDKSNMRFILYLIKTILEKIGYDLYLSWGVIVDYSYNKELQNEVDKMTQVCSEFSPSDKNLLKDPDFVERFIHLFLNCSYLQFPIKIGERHTTFEEEVWRHIANSSVIKNICQTYALNKE